MVRCYLSAIHKCVQKCSALLKWEIIPTSKVGYIGDSVVNP